MEKPDIVKSLNMELLRANKKILALKYGAMSVDDMVWQLENQLKDKDDVIKMAEEKEKEKEIQALKEQVEQLENQLKDKDAVITKEVKKRRARLRAYLDCMAELTDCQAKARLMEACLHQQPPQPDTSCTSEVEKEKEIHALNKKVEQLENQLKDKDDVITKDVKKRRARLGAYLNCMAELTDCQAKANLMEASLHQQPPQPDTSCSSEVEKEKKKVKEKETEKEKEKEKEIQALKEQVEQLQHQLIDKDGVITKEVKKRRARLRAYLDCMAELTDCQAKAKLMEASLHQEHAPGA